jgi:transmembrane protein 222
LEYKQRMHNIFCDNCHSHVAYCLNKMEFDVGMGAETKWNMLLIGAYIFFKGHFVGVGGMSQGFCRTWGPLFMILLGYYTLFH